MLILSYLNHVIPCLQCQYHALLINIHDISLLDLISKAYRIYLLILLIIIIIITKKKQVGMICCCFTADWRYITSKLQCELRKTLPVICLKSCISLIEQPETKREHRVLNTLILFLFHGFSALTLKLNFLKIPNSWSYPFQSYPFRNFVHFVFVDKMYPACVTSGHFLECDAG